ncbi:UNVERIFIED_CONTAM: Transposable element Tcb1 transposase [Trichonephila clavipes]
MYCLVVLGWCGLSYRSIAARVSRCRDSMTVSRIWNVVLDLNGSVSPAPEKNRHFTLIALMHHEATSRIPSQDLGLFARQQVSARTRPWLRLPLTLHHRQEHLKWCDQRRTWAHEWQDVIFSDESRFCLQHQDGRISVRRHRGECILAACIRHRHTGLFPDVMLWDAIGYTSWSSLVRINCSLNIARYFSALRNRTFLQNNARPHVAGNVWIFFDTENVRLSSWPVRLPDLSLIENVWSMVSE